MEKIKMVHTHDWNDNCRHYYKDRDGNAYCRYFNKHTFYTCTEIGEPCDPIAPEHFEIVESFYILEDLRQLAVRAHSLTSHVPEQRGEAMIREHSEELEADLEFVRQHGGDEKRYADNYRKYFSAWLAARGRCVSWMITGRANFPVRKMEKANESERRRADEFRQWREKARRAVLRDFNRANKTPTSEIERVRQQIKDAEAEQGQMKLVNKIVRKYKSNPLGAVAELIEKVGLSEKHARALVMPDCLDDIGYARYRLQNNNANIHRIKERLAELEKKEAASGNETVSLEFTGGDIHLNFEQDRLQIEFPGKPNPETITLLKKNGFRWSPSNQAWQRQLTSNALIAATNVTDVDAKALFARFREVRN